YDASRAADAQGWVDATLARFGRIDAVVANAGIFREVTIDAGAEADLDAMWEINTRAPWRLVRAAWPALAASGTGRVVAVASMSGRRVKNARMTGYAMSKFALVALVEGIRHSGWAHGIRATAICPGYVAIDMSADVRALPPDAMTQPTTVAELVATAIALPNTASLPEIAVNCVLEPR
ncbi:MAG: SDR family NAD(P)-dependent oxidoreductase, partial [Dongiaceae bacterium]